LKSLSANLCVVIVGPTAVGKTSLSIELARYFDTEIISADSRQCYKELNIGVAKPSLQQLQAIPHWFINSHTIHEPCTAADFEAYALQAIDTIFKKNKVAILVGGTGLYINAFVNGLDELPSINFSIKQDIQETYKLKGLHWLQQQVALHDPMYYENGEIQNPHRLLRALEVVLSTGKSIRSFQKNEPKQRRFNIVKIGLNLPRATLYDQINDRVLGMIQEGLVEEVTTLQPYSKSTALQTVGYTEIFEYLNNKISLAEAITAIQQHTRQYAKRQLTWFAKDTSVQWFQPDAYKDVLDYLQPFVK
jgi:tRNA dimethylallyltransferase